ncbi:signal peptide peptidase SppA [Devosia sp.]|uniref:signal peptide peptidase SppA n=1 Tax=Devosia sp. TaxID=1871048 RepID=UPI003266EF65
MARRPSREPAVTDQTTDPHAILAADAYRRSRGTWRIVAFIALAIAVLAVAGRFANNTPVGDQIARIKIDGAITTDPARLEIINDLAKDDRVKAVIVAINSPGGTTAGGEELYEALGALRAKKPVVAVIDELGASAAYMTAIAADRIFARRLSIVGSIGAYVQHVDASKLFGTIGVDLDKVASGPLKGKPEIDEAIDPAVRASLAALVDDTFQWFVDIVSERRGIDRAVTLKLADGGVMSGRMALDAKLIDAVGGENEAIAWLQTDQGIGKDLPVATAFPLPEQGLGWLTQMVGGQARAALGLPTSGPIALDGVVSLWQVE